MQRIAVGKAFDGADSLSMGLDGEHQAGAQGLVVQDDGAGAAYAVLAADMGAGQPAVVADDVDQSAPRFGAHRIVAAVDVKRDVEFLGHGAAYSSSFRGAGFCPRARNP